MPYVHDRFPELDASLRELVQEHSRIAGEPLHLAIAYDAGRDHDDVSRSSSSATSAPSWWTRIAASSRSSSRGIESFRKGGPGRAFAWCSPSPTELDVALRESWPTVVELRRAVATGAYEVLREDEDGGERWHD